MFRNYRPFVLFALVLALCAGCRDSSGASAQPGASAGPVGLPSPINPRFGARGPRKCRSVTNQPTASQIPALIQCNQERGDNFEVYLYEDIVAQTGKTRPYEFKADGHNQDVDTTAAVLPIRGTMVYYSCAPSSDNPGKNCTRTEMPSSTGTCYKTTFGDWRCFMSDMQYLTGGETDMPPPTSN